MVRTAVSCESGARREEQNFLKVIAMGPIRPPEVAEIPQATESGAPAERGQAESYTVHESSTVPFSADRVRRALKVQDGHSPGNNANRPIEHGQEIPL